MILLIEDNIETAALVIRSLENMIVTVVNSLSEARLALSLRSFDLILLDWQLPDGDGFEFFKSLNINTPVIMLAGIEDGPEKAKALDAGVDDYITKPFNRLEFAARVRRRMVRTINSASVSLGDLTIDKNRQVAMVRNETVELTSIEFKILIVLATSPNVTIDRDVIFASVWPDDNSNKRAIDTHVSKLRKKLGADLIESVHGVGYRLAT